MAHAKPRSLLRIAYEEAAERYLRSLPLGHFMEATAQATQRKITLESLDLVHAIRPDVQVFNELLVQYPLGREQTIQQVVPDNMVVVWDRPIEAGGSFNLPFQPVGPYWVLEYVSAHSRRKDYEDNFRRYERDLKVLYYLLFYPDGQELTLYRRGRGKYRAVPPDEAGRCALPELEMAVGLLDGWARFWHRSELLPLPADLQRDLTRTRQQLRQTQEQLARSQARLAKARQQEERLRAQLRALGVEPQP
jgi:Uma2 family endonuclease